MNGSPVTKLPYAPGSLLESIRFYTDVYLEAEEKWIGISQGTVAMVLAVKPIEQLSSKKKKYVSLYHDPTKYYYQVLVGDKCALHHAYVIEDKEKWRPIIEEEEEEVKKG